MIQFEQLFQDLAQTALVDYSDAFKQTVLSKFENYTHGELAEWEQLISQLPELKTTNLQLNDSVSIGSAKELDEQLGIEKRPDFISQLKQLHPWRKGPFNLFGIDIDTEWRSDWKWDRLKTHISPLTNRTVLDVGCGNGYHCWRMFGAGAKVVIGIDPSQKFLAQFNVLKKYIGSAPVHLLPLGIEDMPTFKENIGFDTVFSMGVFYHRRSPIHHLLELKNLLAPRGELILETLIVDGDENTVLVPDDRYAQMRNVWFLPSTGALEKWMAKCGYQNIRTIDVNQTSLDEQRATEWMTFHSLKDYLDPNDLNRTVEGLPAPKRAIVVANI